MLTVGQKLWYVPSYANRGNPQEITIDRVGRKWAYFGYRDRVDIETLRVDGGEYSSPAQCYLSQQAYEDEILLNKAWDEFRKLIDSSHKLIDPSHRLSNITIEKINQAKTILGI